MSPEKIQNLPASVRQRLLNLAKQRREDFQFVLTRFALERLLFVYPTLLGHRAPRLNAYPQETVIAEKFQAMVHLGMANSRMRDFYDLWVLARTFNFEGGVIAEAIRATFQRRQTQIPVDIPTALSTEFESDERKQADWISFLRRAGKDQDPPKLSEVCILLRSFLIPPCQAVTSGTPFEAAWAASGPWRGRRERLPQRAAAEGLDHTVPFDPHHGHPAAPMKP